jgi:branched-chain amino acid transport system permease protein
MAEAVIFNIRSFTGGGAGTPAPRPAGFVSDGNYAYLCMAILAVFVLVDWRMSKTKAGRGVVAVRNNERVAATLGINVAGYKLLAFGVGGFLAGVAGALYAHNTGQAYQQDYVFPDPALIWLLMAVVGGLGSRAGVVIGSAFFAVFPQLLPTEPVNIPSFLQFIGVKTVLLSVTLAPLIGALLLVLTVTMYPGGIGQQLLPIRRWLSGGPFLEKRHRRAPREDEAASPQTEPTEDIQASDRADDEAGDEP